MSACLAKNNGFDFILEAVFKDMKEMRLFTDELDDKFQIQYREVFYIIDELKREAFLGSPNGLSLPSCS